MYKYKLLLSLMLRKIKITIVFLLLIILLTIVTMLYFPSSQRSVDGVIIAITRSQTMLSSSTVLVVSIQENQIVYVKTNNRIIPKTGEMVTLVEKSSIIDGFKRYELID